MKQRHFVSQQDIVIELRDRHKAYGELEVIKGVSIAARRGDVVSLIGSSGSGKSTLLIDADVKTKSVTSRFSLNGAPGLHELVSEGAEFGNCIQRFEPFGLSLVSSTNKSKLEAEKASFPVTDVLGQLDRVRKDFDVVIVDLPPASEANSAVFLATRLEHVFLVAESNKTTSSQAVGVLRKFETSDAAVSGLVLNKYRREFPWEKAV